MSASVAGLVGVAVGAILSLLGNWWMESRRWGREDLIYWRHERRTAYSEAVMAANSYREAALVCAGFLGHRWPAEMLTREQGRLRKACGRWQDVMPTLELIGSTAANRAAVSLNSSLAELMCMASPETPDIGPDSDPPDPSLRSKLALGTHFAIATFVTVVQSELGVPTHANALRPPVATPHFDVES